MGWSAEYDTQNCSALLGKTFDAVEVDRKNDVITFSGPDGVFKFLHDQCCCESVVIEDVNGNVEDLVGSPIVRAEENSNDDGQMFWTFYRIGTTKGTVVFRWSAEDNYYSTSVDFVQVVPLPTPAPAQEQGVMVDILKELARRFGPPPHRRIKVRGN